MSTDNGNSSQGVGGGMFRRMVSFVSGQGRPAGAGGEMPASQFAELEKAELKAMIERKRRNDFIRKRELDMLRRIRREGVGAEENSPLAASSHMDDSEIRPTQFPAGPDLGVKAKIDAIEKQMVGLSSQSVSRSSASSQGSTARPGARDASGLHALTQPMVNSHLETLPMDPAAAPTVDMSLTKEMSLDGLAALHAQLPGRPPVLTQAIQPGAAPAGRPAQPGARPGVPPARPGASASPAAAPAVGIRPAMPASAKASPVGIPPAAPGRAPAPAARPGMASQPAAPVRPAVPEVPPPAMNSVSVGRLGHSADSAFMVEVNEVAQDHEMDEAVIAYANADFTHCERILTQLVSRNGMRHRHQDTWMTLFDFYRATGRQDKFEQLTMEFVQVFQRSGPQWFSLPKLVAEATANSPSAQQGNAVGWLCPRWLTVDALSELNSQTLQLPQPWVMDWSELQRIEPDAAERMRAMFAGWARQSVKLRWTEAERLVSVLAEATPAGMRDVDPSFWMARLETLRIINRADQFDEVAIDYCVTYEVSPPSWEPARCDLLLGGSSLNTQSADLSVLGDVVTNMEGANADETAVASLELSGQLAGDQTSLLDTLDHRLGDCMVVNISCALLIRVDFIAAGDLLNWVISKRTDSRSIKFTEVHRLVALMFSAMGINEHAPVQLRLN